MFKRPHQYVNDLHARYGGGLDLSSLTYELILGKEDNLHFTTPRGQLNLAAVCTALSKGLPLTSEEDVFTPQVGSRILNLADPNCARTIRCLAPKIVLVDKKGTRYEPSNLRGYVPVTCDAEKQGSVYRRCIEGFKAAYGATTAPEFLCYHKLLVVADFKVFQAIDGEQCPACFVSQDDQERLSFQYNSPILPKIVVLKSLLLLRGFLEKHPSRFTTCIVAGATRLTQGLISLRKHYHEGVFNRVLIFAEHPVEADLGNGATIKRWNWTLPEIACLNQSASLQVKIEEVNNPAFDTAAEAFYKAVKDLEDTNGGISLSDALRFVRRLCYDWSLCCENTRHVLAKIEVEFAEWLQPWLYETLLPYNPDADCEKCARVLQQRFKSMVMALANQNKSEALRIFKQSVAFLVAPAGWTGRYTEEVKVLRKPRINKNTETLNSLQALAQLGGRKPPPQAAHDGYNCITQVDIKCTSLAKLESPKEGHCLLTTIYRHGSMDKLMLHLTTPTREYTLLLYGPEQRAWNYHVARHFDALQREWASADRYSISCVRYEAVSAPAVEPNDWVAEMERSYADNPSEAVRITFTDRTKEKLPAERGVLCMHGCDFKVTRAGELQPGDEVRIYSNNSPELIRQRIQEAHPELAKLEDRYAALWKSCLLAFYQRQVISKETLYQRLKEKRFSVSMATMVKYLAGEVRFPRRHRDLLAIVQTIEDPTFSETVLRHEVLPVVRQFDGKAVSYGQQVSEAINHYIITHEMPESLKGWLTAEEVKAIAGGIPKRKIADIELLTTTETADDE